MELTELEKELLEELRNDQFILECGMTWTEFFLEDCSMGSKKARGVLSSLEQKGIIKIMKLEGGNAIELLEEEGE